MLGAADRAVAGGARCAMKKRHRVPVRRAISIPPRFEIPRGGEWIKRGTDCDGRGEFAGAPVEPVGPAFPAAANDQASASERPRSPGVRTVSGSSNSTLAAGVTCRRSTSCSDWLRPNSSSASSHLGSRSASGVRQYLALAKIRARWATCHNAARVPV